ncbi:cytochrome P450 2B4-like [Tubulanus polymorphus]|uniref:cytochrome P450 2B4-like n=1 Tax=Tubulanus polymorphus TaxID=672921 RepID=UPI003DA3C58E
MIRSAVLKTPLIIQSFQLTPASVHIYRGQGEQHALCNRTTQAGNEVEMFDEDLIIAVNSLYLQMIFRIVCLCALVGLAFYLAYISQDRSRYQYPPGPFSWPIIGNLATIARRPVEMYLVIEDIRRVHGNIFSLYFGNKLAVFINGNAAVKDALVDHGHMFSTRPKSAMRIWGKLFKRKGLGMLRGKELETVKRATKSALRNLSYGSAFFNERMNVEMSALKNEIEKKAGQPFMINDLALKSLANVICSITLGKRFDYEDKQFNQLISLVFKFLNFLHVDLFENYIPVLGFVNPFSKTNILMKVLQDTDDIITQFIEDHKATFDACKVRDFIDVFLLRQKTDADNQVFSDETLKTMIHSLFMAGIESTQVALRWFCLYMLHYPDTQARCQVEIDQVIGQDRPPKITHRDGMPYMQATIHELLRHCNIAPLGAPHAANEDVIFHGFYIPKDTMVFFNFYGIHMDEKLWPDAHAFKPERWLNEQGNFVKSNKGFLPFSMGPRYCLGDQLAKRELFLMFTSLLQCFKLDVPDHIELPPLKGIQRLSLGPQDYLMRAIQR